MDCPIAAKYQSALVCFSVPNQHRILQYLAHLAARQFTGLTLTAVVRALPGPAGAFKQKGTVSLCMSLILISGRVFWSIYGAKEPLSRR